MSNKKININQYLENFPNSKKIYIVGTKENIRVPFRMIEQTATNLNGITEKNDPIYVYDTTGPYTDGNHDIDVFKGLDKIRQDWINNRGDTRETLQKSVDFLLNQYLRNQRRKKVYL